MRECMMQAGNAYISSVCANKLCQDVAQSRQDTCIKRRLHNRSRHNCDNHFLGTLIRFSVLEDFKMGFGGAKCGVGKDIGIFATLNLGTDSQDTGTPAASRYTVEGDDQNIVRLWSRVAGLPWPPPMEGAVSQKPQPQRPARKHARTTQHRHN